MSVTGALIRDTFREALARKVFWAFFFSSTALLVFFLLIMRIDVVQGMVASVPIFGQQGHPHAGMSAEQMVMDRAGRSLGISLHGGNGAGDFRFRGT